MRYTHIFQTKPCAFYSKMNATMPQPSIQPYKEERPWGSFTEFTRNSLSTVKIITVEPGQSLSLQTHKERDEFWRIISGTGTVQIGTERASASAGMDYFVPRGTAHRIEAGNEALALLEIALGNADENDIVRLEDRYGRSN